MCDGSICLVFFFHLAKEHEVEHNSVLRIKHISPCSRMVHKDDNEFLNAEVHRKQNLNCLTGLLSEMPMTDRRHLKS